MSFAAAQRTPVSRYRPPQRGPAAPLPPRWQEARAGRKPPFAEFILLSMLLHALAIVLFGAPSGGSREGRAMWGPLHVVLQPRPAPVEAPPLKMDRTLAVPKPPAPAASRIAPEVKKEIERTAKPIVPERERAAKPAIPAVPKGATVADPAAKAPEALAIPPLLDRLVSPERKLDVPPPLQVPLPTLEAAPSAGAAAGDEVAAPPAAPRVPIEAVPMEPVIVPRVDRALTEPPALTAPLAQPVPPPEPQRSAAPPVEQPPVETSAIPVTPSARPTEPPPVEVQAIPVPPIESIAPPRVEPAPKPVESMAPPRVEPAPKPVESMAPPRVEPAPKPIEKPVTPEREPPARIDPPQIDRERPSPRPSPKAEGEPGAPPRGEGELRSAPRDALKLPGRDSPSTDYDPTAPSPRLDVDALRRRASELGRQGTGNRALLPFAMPPVAPPKSKMETAIENARKPDCRDAYKSLGLAAIVPLIANEFGEGKCRW